MSHSSPPLSQNIRDESCLWDARETIENSATWCLDDWERWARGRDLNALDRQGNCMLCAVIENTPWNRQEEAQKLVECLLRHGSSPNVVSSYGSTPLLLALINGLGGVADVLLEAGAKPYDVRQQCLHPMKTTPLHEAARSCKDTAVVRRLIQSGAPIEITDRDGWTPLAIAVQTNNPSGVLALLQEGATAQWSDENHQTLLHMAAKTRSVVNIYALIDAGASPKAVTREGVTPLHALMAQRWISFGEYRQRVRSVEALLQGGASPNDQDAYGQTPMDLSLTWGCVENRVLRAMMLHGGQWRAARSDRKSVRDRLQDWAEDFSATASNRRRGWRLLKDDEWWDVLKKPRPIVSRPPRPFR